MLAYVLHVDRSGSGYGNKNKLGEDHSPMNFLYLPALTNLNIFTDFDIIP